MVKVTLVASFQDERLATQEYHIVLDFPSLPFPGLVISARKLNFHLVVEQVEYCPFSNTAIARLQQIQTKKILDEIDFQFVDAGWEKYPLNRDEMIK